MTVGSIVVPAHNESAVIVRTIGPLVPLVERGVEIIVSCNGCTDDTAAQARSIPGVMVLESPIASKAHALNAADSVATRFPRLYLDADVTITANAIVAVSNRLRGDDILAARPPFHYDMTGTDRLVAAYFRARNRIPGMHEHLWGAGAYALSEAGHRRLGSFPVLHADDLYVDGLFDRTEIEIIETDPVSVRCPRSWRVLLSTLRRVQSGKRQVSDRQDVVPVGGLRPLLTSLHDAASLRDALVYAVFSLVARAFSWSQPDFWHRDETNRSTPDRAPLPGSINARSER